MSRDRRQFIFECPEHLSDEAKSAWARMVKYLPAATLNVIDADILAIYSAAYARWQNAEREVAKSGSVIKSPAGFPIENPFLKVAKDASRSVNQCLGILRKAEKEAAKASQKPGPKLPTFGEQPDAEEILQ